MTRGRRPWWLPCCPARNRISIAGSKGQRLAVRRRDIAVLRSPGRVRTYARRLTAGCSATELRGNGAGGRSRTCDASLRRAALCPLSYVRIGLFRLYCAGVKPRRGLGAGGRSRTCDASLRRAALCPLSYVRIFRPAQRVGWPGTGGGIRTPAARVWKPLLCPLSYASM